MANLASAVIIGGKVNTTLKKAKFARAYVEKLITQAAKNRLSSNRVLASRLPADAFNRLIKEVGPQFKNRNGGYTRIIKTGVRLGDDAPMARLELLPFEKKPATRESAPGDHPRGEVKASPGKHPGAEQKTTVDHPRKSAIDQRESA